MKRIKGMVLTGEQLSGKDRMRILDQYALDVYRHVSDSTRPVHFAHLYGGGVLIPGGAVSDDTLPWPMAKQVAEPIAGVSWLHDYQYAALRDLLALERALLVAPAGSGKTHIGVALCACIGVRTVIICPTREIVAQWEDRLIGRVGKDAKIWVTTYQTARNRPRELGIMDMVIVDEAHRAPCSSIARIMSMVPGRYRYGLTATPKRADGLTQALYWMFSSDVVTIDREHTKQAIVPVEVYRVNTGFPLPRGYDFVDLHNALAENEARNKFILDIISWCIKQGRVTICLAERVEQLKFFQERLDKGCSCCIVGDTPKTERKQYMEQLRTGKMRCLLATYALAGEGMDIPVASALVLAAPTGNARKIEQAGGRVARVHPGKPEPRIYDLVDYGGEKMFNRRVTVYNRLGWRVKA